MEISNDIKAKVFAQYLGQRLQRGGMMTIELLYACKNAAYNTYDDIVLKLKPLSAIADEDAIEVSTMLWGNKMPNPMETIKHQLFTYSVSDVPARCYQLLQSKGYDLPQYLLGGKTLHEAGLAIYE